MYYINYVNLHSVWVKILQFLQGYHPHNKFHFKFLFTYKCTLKIRLNMLFNCFPAKALHQGLKPLTLGRHTSSTAFICSSCNYFKHIWDTYVMLANIWTNQLWKHVHAECGDKCWKSKINNRGLPSMGALYKSAYKNNQSDTRRSGVMWFADWKVYA